MADIDHDLLARKAEALVKRLQEATRWQETPEVGKTQASKAIEVAQSAPTPSLFINWLRYQTARESADRRFWSYSLEPQQTLAEALAADLRDIVKDLSPEQRMRAVTLYLGYFRRALVGMKYLDRIPLL